MNTVSNYIEINKKSWNKRTDVHLKSNFYDVEGFLKGNSSLNEIELNLLGDVKGKSILHLQCHFGQDSISLGRLGANVTGIDLSDNAIINARKLAEITKVNTTFVCSDVYELPKHLDQQFDIIYTSYGVISWLPDLDKWAKVIRHFLKPNGKFVFVEFHPAIYMFDDNFEKIRYSYFNSKAHLESLNGTYTDGGNNVFLESVEWNHSLSEVINSLIQNNLSINSLDEFDYSPYACFNKMIEAETKKYRIKHLSNNIPMIYSIVATKTE